MPHVLTPECSATPVTAVSGHSLQGCIVGSGVILLTHQPKYKSGYECHKHGHNNKRSVFLEKSRWVVFSALSSWFSFAYSFHLPLKVFQFLLLAPCCLFQARFLHFCLFLKTSNKIHLLRLSKKYLPITMQIVFCHQVTYPRIHNITTKQYSAATKCDKIPIITSHTLALPVVTFSIMSSYASDLPVVIVIRNKCIES